MCVCVCVCSHDMIVAFGLVINFWLILNLMSLQRESETER